mmetsp:Transcript_29459/g.59239  ORF Transcript_29459/g.59239 Transcript_29459/m.59239 type:complete len:311 (-) Transcript_29459:84-1016(-)
MGDTDVTYRLRNLVDCARINERVNEIRDEAFMDCVQLVRVWSHDGVKKIGDRSFSTCKMLRNIELSSVVGIGMLAFGGCRTLTDVDFGSKLEEIGYGAFCGCSSLRRLHFPSVFLIDPLAFQGCVEVTDVEFSVWLQRIGSCAFKGCTKLQRIVMPLDVDIIKDEVFDRCENLTKVELVGEIHEIVPYLSLKSWREAVYEQIDYINQVLPNTPANEKTEEIKEWMESVKDSYEYYKAVHFCWVEDVTTLLELALWKINIDGKERNLGFQDGDQTTRERAQGESRQEKRVTSGASVVIKHVISFIELPWTF